MTDKMLSRKDGGVGYVIFNNPERHNAVSLRDVGGDALPFSMISRNDDSMRVVVLTGAGGKALRVGRRYFQIR